jgi:CO/xanthine dehydrogenase FAD-binding subunit
MDFFAPSTLEEALAIRAQRPEAVVIAGGTDVMVAMNFGKLRPPAMLDISRVEALRQWYQEDGWFFLGSGVTYSTVVEQLTRFEPLVQACRAVGSPQIRNTGTIGGNVGTASPAGDALPVLAAYDAEIVLASSRRGRRSIPWDRFLLGVKRTDLKPDELIVGIRWRPTQGPGSFSKVGTRNAMVIAVASLCLVVDKASRSVRVSLGSVGPTVIRARKAETFAAGVFPWAYPRALLSEDVLEHFATIVADAVRPIDDVRGSAVYRRQCCRILARRALTWASREWHGQGEGETV